MMLDSAALACGNRQAYDEGNLEPPFVRSAEAE
jgi:hypothetical protein